MENGLYSTNIRSEAHFLRTSSQILSGPAALMTLNPPRIQRMVWCLMTISDIIDDSTSEIADGCFP